MPDFREVLITIAAAVGIGLVVCSLAAWLEERFRHGSGAASETTGQRAFWGYFLTNFWFFLFGVAVAMVVDYFTEVY